MSIALRPVQSEFIENLRSEFARHRRVLGVAVTGFGKTVCFAAITKSAVEKQRRVIITAHRYEIVDQISNALARLGVKHGRIQAGHTCTNDLVQVAMVATLARRIDRVPEPDLFVIDECHHAVTGSYEAITSHWTQCRILGVTATPERLDGKGLGAAFDTMVVAPGMREMIEAGYLAKFRYLAPPTSMDLSGVKTRMGDYSIDELAAVMDKAVITGSAVGHYAQHLNGRPAIAFCCTVAHAESVAEQFRQAGWKAASVDGTMERTKRRDLLASIGDGRLNVLSSCALISEGVDIPAVAGAILLRPTKSLSLYLQSVGRVLRVDASGSDAVILDHTSLVHTHGMPDAPREWSLDAKKRKPAAVGVTTCEECYRVFPSGPNWRADQTCLNGAPSGCILNTPDKPAERAAMPEEVAGTLTEISTVADWSGGLDLIRSPLSAVLKTAKTREQVDAIRKARKYHPRWTHHIMSQRANRNFGDAVPFVPMAAPVTRAPEIEEVLFS